MFHWPVWSYSMSAHISPEYVTYLNLDGEMLARPPIVGTKSSLKKTQDGIDRAYVDWQCDTFMIDNVLMHHILLKIFTDMDAYIYVKQRKSTNDG